MERIDGAAVVQLRGTSGEPLGIAVTIRGRVCFARAHGEAARSSALRPVTGFLREIVERARAEGSLAKALEGVADEQVAAVAPGFRERIAWELSCIARAAGEAKLRSRWRPLSGDFDPRLAFSVRDLFLDLVRLASLEVPGPQAAPGASTLVAVRDEVLTGGFPVPVGFTGFEGASLRWLLALARSSHQLLTAARAMPEAPADQLRVHHLGRWLAVTGDADLVEVVEDAPAPQLEVPLPVTLEAHS